MSAPPEQDPPTTFLEYLAFGFLALLVFLGGCGVERWLG